MSRVKEIKKVNVSVKLKDGTGVGGQAEAVSCSFIYGIGRDGLSPFECCLDGARVGDRIVFEVKSADIGEYFSGLLPTFHPLVDGKILPGTLSFEVEVKGIGDVENREVVAALASSASGCGSGGDCGCGCS